MTESYCLRCRATREIANGQRTITASGRLAIVGPCSVCGMRLSRIVKSGNDCAPCGHWQADHEGSQWGICNKLGMRTLRTASGCSESFKPRPGGVR